MKIIALLPPKVRKSIDILQKIPANAMPLDEVSKANISGSGPSFALTDYNLSL